MEYTNIKINSTDHKPALVIVGIVIFILIIIGIISSVSYYIFRSKKVENTDYTGYSLPSSKEYTVNIHGAFQSEGFKKGIYGLNIMSGLKSITEDNPIISTTNNTVRTNILQKDQIKVDTVDLTKTEDFTYNSPYKKLDWLSYKDNIPSYRWEKISKIKGIPDLYVTEGGVFTEDEMKPTMELYFIKNGWDKEIEIVFIKMSFPNGKMPFNSTYENNTIATYFPLSEKQKYKIINTYGIPENSKLVLVTRNKNDGDEKIMDTFLIKRPTNRLYIDGNKGITLTI